MLVGLTSGCTTASFIAQATYGQLAIMNRARPIVDVVRDEKTPESLRVLLKEVPRIKTYGELKGLKPTPNYRDYVKLDREAVLWVVTASEKLKFQPKIWDFPIAGSFNSLGWFSKERAIEFGKDLRVDTGMDVDVRPARAFSTLNWFRDPIVSTMITDDNSAMGELVNVVLHESVHATLYIQDQSYFNESLASFVADDLTGKYLRERFGPQSPELNFYLEGEKKGLERERLLLDAYQELDELYRAPMSDTEKLDRKADILDKLKADLKTNRDLNNASLIQFRTYGTGLREFGLLFEACQKDWGNFWQALMTIREGHFRTPHQEDFGIGILMPLVRKGCGSANSATANASK